jgi:hypothetical protein
MPSKQEIEAAAEALSGSDDPAALVYAEAALTAAEKVREDDWQREIDAIHEAAWNLVVWADREELEVCGNSGKALEGLRVALNRECPVCLFHLDGCTDWHVIEGPAIVILTLEGEMTAQVGDYIIKGVEGEFYPCKPGIFEATYEAVDGSDDE